MPDRFMLAVGLTVMPVVPTLNDSETPAPVAVAGLEIVIDPGVGGLTTGAVTAVTVEFTGMPGPLTTMPVARPVVDARPEMTALFWTTSPLKLKLPPSA